MTSILQQHNASLHVGGGYQYIKILTVCLCVCNGSGKFVGRD